MTLAFRVRWVILRGRFWFKASRMSVAISSLVLGICESVLLLFCFGFIVCVFWIRIFVLTQFWGSLLCGFFGLLF